MSTLAEIDRTQLTGVERTFDDNQIIVSKTDKRGMLTYMNDLFVEISGYEEADLFGKPHSLIRHPHMPRTIFKLLWDTIKEEHEIFAYVVNRCKNGDHYWVLAHVTPTHDLKGVLNGYHSNRRKPKQKALDVIIPLYERIRKIEQIAGSGRESLAAGKKVLDDLLAEKGATYDEFILSL